jgi:hypothetical protein
MNLVSRIWNSDGETSTAVVVATTAVATISVLALSRYALWPSRPKIIKGPLQSVIPRLSRLELQAVDYRPDHFPGARDVETPVGSLASPQAGCWRTRADAPLLGPVRLHTGL